MKTKMKAMIVALVAGVSFLMGSSASAQNWVAVQSTNNAALRSGTWTTGCPGFAKASLKFVNTNGTPWLKPAPGASSITLVDNLGYPSPGQTVCTIVNKVTLATSCGIGSASMPVTSTNDQFSCTIYINKEYPAGATMESMSGTVF